MMMGLDVHVVDTIMVASDLYVQDVESNMNATVPQPTHSKQYVLKEVPSKSKK